MMRMKELRAFALSLPEAEERETWGEATFRVRDRIFVMAAPDHAGRPPDPDRRER